MRYLVSYDIARPRRRVAVARLLLGHGERVQQSVFELELREPQWRRLCIRLDALIDKTDDQWRGWRVCASDLVDSADIGLPGPLLREGATVV